MKPYFNFADEPTDEFTVFVKQSRTRRDNASHKCSVDCSYDPRIGFVARGLETGEVVCDFNETWAGQPCPICLLAKKGGDHSTVLSFSWSCGPTIAACAVCHNPRPGRPVALCDTSHALAFAAALAKDVSNPAHLTSPDEQSVITVKCQTCYRTYSKKWTRLRADAARRTIWCRSCTNHNHLFMLRHSCTFPLFTSKFTPSLQSQVSFPWLPNWKAHKNSIFRRFLTTSSHIKKRVQWEPLATRLARVNPEALARSYADASASRVFASAHEGLVFRMLSTVFGRDVMHKAVLEAPVSVSVNGKVTNMRFDVAFIYRDRLMIVEIDGDQHFRGNGLNALRAKHVVGSDSTAEHNKSIIRDAVKDYVATNFMDATVLRIDASLLLTDREFVKRHIALFLEQSEANVVYCGERYKQLISCDVHDFLFLFLKIGEDAQNAYLQNIRSQTDLQLQKAITESKQRFEMNATWRGITDAKRAQASKILLHKFGLVCF